MIVYTTRGGVSAVIWTDVVQMFIYVAGALVVFVALLQQIDGGWSAVVAAGDAAGKFRVFDFTPRPHARLHVLVGPARRRRADAGHARHRSVPGAAAALRAIGAQRRVGADPERRHRLRAVRAVPRHRRDALRLLPADAAAAAARHATTRSCRSSSSTSLSHGAAGFIVAAIVAAALSPSINSLAATTVNDFYLKYVRPDADEETLMRVSRRATIFWGVAQIGGRARRAVDHGRCSTPASRCFRSPPDRCSARSSSACSPSASDRARHDRRHDRRRRRAARVWWTVATAWTWYAFVGVVGDVRRRLRRLVRACRRRSHASSRHG